MSEHPKRAVDSSASKPEPRLVVTRAPSHKPSDLRKEHFTPLSLQVRRFAWPAGLVALAILLRFTALSYPSEVIFDEFHYGKMVNSYCCSQQRFFDVHPPPAKLLLAGAAKMGGYGGTVPFERIGQSFGSESPVAVRWLPALIGALLPLIVFLLIRQLGGSRPISFLGGLMLAFDNSLIVESRVIGLNMIQLTATFGSLSLFLHALRRDVKLPWLCLMGAGSTAAFAVGSKFTGIAIFGLFVVILARPLLRHRDRKLILSALWRLVWVMIPAIAVYLVSWQVHYQLLKAPGPGDPYYRVKGQFVEDTLQLHRLMFKLSAGLKAGHPSASRWYMWPGMRKTIFYWTGQNRAIYLCGNPLVWFGTGFMLLVIFGIVGLSRITTVNVLPARGSPISTLWVPAAGWVISYFPFMLMTRPMFLYHYFTPLIFGLIVVLLWLDRAEWIISSRLTGQRRSFYVVAGLLIAAFLFLVPVTYGFSVPQAWYELALSFARFFA